MILIKQHHNRELSPGNGSEQVRDKEKETVEQVTERKINLDMIAVIGNLRTARANKLIDPSVLSGLLATTSFDMCISFWYVYCIRVNLLL
jgi:uncharacterized protein YjbK